MIKVKRLLSLLIIVFLIFSNFAYALSPPEFYEGKPIDESKEGKEYYKEGQIIVYPHKMSSKEEEMMKRFHMGDLSEEEMRVMAKTKFGDTFSEYEFQKGMMEFKERMNRREAFSYEHEGFEQRYPTSPSYEGYSKEHMVLGMIFGYVGDDIDPREIKQYCNDPNKIADMIISKLKEKVGDLQKICDRIDEQESKCDEIVKRSCSQIGTAMVRQDATEREKIESVAYSCPVSKDAIKETCKRRSKFHMEQRLQTTDESCKQRFNFEGDRLIKECERFKQQVVCDKEKYIKQCLTNFGVEKTKPCPLYPVPACDAGSTLKTKTDDKGCVSYYCKTAPCPTVEKPTCAADEQLQTYYDNAGCVTSYQCLKYQTNCPEVAKLTCSEGQSLTTKYDERGCIIGYDCVSVPLIGSVIKITGQAVLSTHDDFLRQCENNWISQQRICSNMQQECDKEAFIDKCKEHERKNYDDFILKVEQHCESTTIAEVRHAEQRCARIGEDRERCLEQSSKRCMQMKGMAQQCRDLLTEDKLRSLIIEEAKKRCKFTDIIEDEDDVRKAEKVEIVLAVLNTVTKDDLDKLDLYVENLHEELKLQDTTVYKGTIDPNRFGDIKLLPFVVNAKISTVTSSERAKEVKAKIVARQKVEDIASKLVSLRNSDVPSEYLYIIEDKASEVLDVSDNLEEIEKKEDQKGFGYKIRLFLGLAKKAEQEEIKQLGNSKEKLSNSIDTLTKLIDEVPSDVAKAILKEQVENLKKQQEDMEVFIEVKEKKSKGLFGIFG